MPKAAAQSRSYWHPEFQAALAERWGGDEAKVDWSVVLDVYARVSRATDERYRSTQGQVEECVEHVLDQGYIPGMVHVDDSLSAWNEKIIRPAWEQMMARLESGQTGGIMVWNLTRFARRVRDGERLIEAAERRMKILDSDAAHDLTSPTGKKNFRNSIVEAAYYSDQLSKNVQRGKRNKARNGEFNVGFRIYGFDLPGHTVNEREAGVLREAAQRLLAGESQEAILRWMNSDLGERTTRGGLWARKALREALLRKLNVGQVTHNGKVMARREEQIFTEAEQAEIEAFYAGRRRGRPTPYLCVGVLRCECGVKMYGRTMNHRDGSLRVRYYCSRGRGEGDKVAGCGQSIEGAHLEAFVRQLTIELLTSARYAEATAALSAEEDTERSRLQAQLERDQRTAAGLDAKLAADEIDYERYDAMTGAINRRIKANRDALKALGTVTDLTPKIDAGQSRRELAELWDHPNTTIEQRRGLLHAALGGRELTVRRGVHGAKGFDHTRVSLGALAAQSA